MCTWVDCTEKAEFPQKANDGSIWARLCPEHHKMLDDALGVDVKKTLSYWIKAQGGAKAAAARMTR